MGMQPEILKERLFESLKQKFLNYEDETFGNEVFKLEIELDDGTRQITLLGAACKVIAETVADEVVNHITTYAEATSTVNTTVTVEQGIPVATVGSATAQTGSTTASGMGTGSGVGKIVSGGIT